MSWRPRTYRLSEEEYVEAYGLDGRCHHLILSWWRLPNDIGFLVNRRSFHLLREDAFQF